MIKYKGKVYGMISEIVDKVCIWLLCMMLMLVYGCGMAYVVVCLMAVIIVLSSYLERLPERTEELLIIINMLCIARYPVCMAFVPLFMYDAVCKKMKYALVAAAVTYICNTYTYIKSAGDVKAGSGYLITGAICVLLISIAAVVLGNRTMRWKQAEDDVRRIRDDGIERHMLLEHQNAEIIERQNYEINVATLRERNRIAREIHDNVGHMLTRAILQTGALKVIVKDDAVKGQLEGLGATLNTAMDNIRNSVHDLHDESVDMGRAVEEVIGNFPKLDVELDYDVKSNVSSEMKYSFISIVKEALNNTAKHSNGSKVKIILSEHPAFYQLIIADNGTDIPDNFTGGMGISSIRERVKSLHGNININTEKGFRISISVMK